MEMNTSTGKPTWPHSKPTDEQIDKISQWVLEHEPLFMPLEHSPLAKNPFHPNQRFTSLPYQGNSRLGFWYQHVCHQHFLSHPHYDVLLEEVQLFHQDKKTIGAIDFLIHDHQHIEIQHWEVAVKFYLLHENLWYGPNSRDRLDLKLAHMLNHQLKMTQTASFQQSYAQYKHIQPKLLMQGRLYVNPFLEQSIPNTCLGYALNQSQIQGKWCYQSQRHLISEPLYPLAKADWLTGKSTLTKPLTEIGDKFVHCQSQSGQFWFIVPNTWPEHQS